MKKYILLLIVLLPFISNANDFITIDSLSEEYDLNSFCYNYTDKEDNKQIEDIIALKEESWEKLPDVGPMFGQTRYIQWVRITIINDSDSDLERFLYIPFNSIKYIKPFLVTGNKITAKPVYGTNYSYKEKDLHSRNYYIKLNIPQRDTTILYVQLINKYESLKASMFLVNETRAMVLSVFNNSFIWLWRGTFLFALIITIVLYSFIRLKLFLYYFILNIGVILFIGSEIGDFFMFFDSDPHNFIMNFKYLGTAIIYMFFPLFLNSIVKISDNSPRIWKLMFYIIYLNWAVFFLSMFPQIKSSSFLLILAVCSMLSAVIIFLLQLYFLAFSVKKKQEGALFLFILYAFYIGSVAISVILPNLGIGKVNPYTYNSLFSGSIIEIFTFMFLMGNETVKVYKQKNNLMKKQHSHQRDLMLAVVNGQEQERNKLGRDLHDMVGGNLALIKHKIEEYNGELKTLISRTIQDVRGMSHGLVTPSIQGDEFKDEVLQLANNISEANKLKVNVIFHEWPELKNRETITHLYRIIQELLQNAIKHSIANYVFLQFLGGETLLVLYEDDGVGFDYDDKLKHGVGLKNIEYRVKVLNCNINVESSSKSGTSIFIELPPQSKLFWN